MPDRATAPAPLIAGSDIAVAVSIPVLKLVARVLPESAWSRFGRLAARTGPDPARSGRADLDTRMRQMLRYASNASEPNAVLADLRALEIEAVLQTWRAGQRPDWHPNLRLLGTEHLDSALAAGTGAVLWVGHFVFASLFAKIALHDAGYEVSHLSHPRHGFSQTRFGMRFLNRGKQEIEAKFLAERVELAPANPAIALRRLQKRLAGNGIVSFTAGVDAARPAFPPFFGDRIALATGAADLAHRSGAPLLPVFVWRDEPGEIAVEIEAPLPVDRAAPRPKSGAAAANAFAERQAIHVRARPEQWLGWTTLPPLEDAG